jgi:hypothetical protein
MGMGLAGPTGFRYLSVRISPGHEAAMLQQVSTTFAVIPFRRPLTAEWIRAWSIVA